MWMAAMIVSAVVWGYDLCIICLSAQDADRDDAVCLYFVMCLQ